MEQTLRIAWEKRGNAHGCGSLASVHSFIISRCFRKHYYYWCYYRYWKWRVIITVNFQCKQLEGRSLKNIRASTEFEPVTSAIPVRCSTNWAVKPHNDSELNLVSSCLSVQWNDVKYLWNAYPSFQLLKLEIYCVGHSSVSSTIPVEYAFSFIFHIIPLHGKTWTQQIDLARNVWLHSLVGRASHRYRGGHGFESRWSPDIFQASFFQLLKLEIYCDDHSSRTSLSVPWP